jgi:uncharacterized protein with PQ loop repeat
MEEEKNLSEKESLDLIAMMINKAKDSYRDTGLSAIMWGTVITICSLVHLSEVHFGYKLPIDIYWLTVLAIVPQVFITIKEKKGRKIKAYDDRFMDYIWLAFGISIFLMSFILNAIFRVWDVPSSGFDHPLREFVAPFFLLLYGIPTFVTGAACKVKPMIWGGLLCWVCCIITLRTTIKIDLLLTAFSAVFAWLIPGILMERDYRKAKKGLAKAHV